VLERGERIELLVDKTDDLRFQAEKFQKQGKQLRQKMRWNNTRIIIIVVLCVILLAVVVFLLACFAGGNNCIQKFRPKTQ
jgi:vesicle-associated membrane protein 7